MLSVLLSIILGLTIGLIVGYLIFKKVMYKGPDSKDIIGKIFTDDSGYKYQWEPQVCICPISLSMDKIADPTFVVDGH